MFIDHDEQYMLSKDLIHEIDSTLIGRSSHSTLPVELWETWCVLKEGLWEAGSWLVVEGRVTVRNWVATAAVPLAGCGWEEATELSGWDGDGAGVWQQGPAQASPHGAGLMRTGKATSGCSPVLTSQSTQPGAGAPGARYTKWHPKSRALQLVLLFITNTAAHRPLDTVNHESNANICCLTSSSLEHLPVEAEADTATHKPQSAGHGPVENTMVELLLLLLTYGRQAVCSQVRAPAIHLAAPPEKCDTTTAVVSVLRGFRRSSPAGLLRIPGEKQRI